MRWSAAALIGLLALALAPSALGQAMPKDEDVWTRFVAWARANPTREMREYVAKLGADGLTETEVQRQLGVIRRLLQERPLEGTELTYDRIYSKPLTGDPAKDGFNSAPNAFLVEVIEELEPGLALDVGSGQGRNAVYLATRGWSVTGIDISGAGLATTRANAEKAGVEVSTVKTTYQDYDFGTERWDLIAMVLSWAPVEEPAFAQRLVTSLRTGGVLVFEHVIQKDNDPFPAYVHALQPEVLKGYFASLSIDRYEEVTEQGDWGGPPARLVRMVAHKP